MLLWLKDTKENLLIFRYNPKLLKKKIEKWKKIILF